MGNNSKVIQLIAINSEGALVKESLKPLLDLFIRVVEPQLHPPGIVFLKLYYIWYDDLNPF